MGVASLVLGIMGLVISLFWGKLGIFGLILAIPAIIFGAIARNGKGHKTMPTIGLVLGCVALPFAIISFGFWNNIEKITNGCSKKIERSFNFDKNSTENNDSSTDGEENDSDSRKRLEEKMDKLSDAIEEKLNKMFFED
ncbi:MAG: DUF4190 domain-containing protein [Treponema sp.]|uniref:DUF4190 domain-containing protein n=1 Tax=Treponema sp. TaxID=166 RepID=UPI00298D639A|nr:DUF4190 domain-containing protein [Treponema sp.]MCQ2600727.1 DUF4190 domain-containing protein [Treponema sp.]